MADHSIASADRAAGEPAGTPEARKPFAAPAVDDLGKLQALTQQFGGTVGMLPDRKSHLA